MAYFCDTNMKHQWRNTCRAAAAAAAAAASAALRLKQFGCSAAVVLPNGMIIVFHCSYISYIHNVYNWRYSFLEGLAHSPPPMSCSSWRSVAHLHLILFWRRTTPPSHAQSEPNISSTLFAIWEQALASCQK